MQQLAPIEGHRMAISWDGAADEGGVQAKVTPAALAQHVHGARISRPDSSKGSYLYAWLQGAGADVPPRQAARRAPQGGGCRKLHPDAGGVRGELIGRLRSTRWTDLQTLVVELERRMQNSHCRTCNGAGTQ